MTILNACTKKVWKLIEWTTHMVNFKGSITRLNSDNSFSQTDCLTTVKESCLRCYLHIDGERIDGLLCFPKTLVQREIQKVPIHYSTLGFWFRFLDDNR